VLLLSVLRDPSLVPRDRIAALRAHSDPALRLAFHSMHSQPGKRWTLSLLARSAGLSRSAFAQRFTELAGIPAMTYLRRHRLAMVETRLREGLSLVQATRKLGFRSIAAFKRAQSRLEYSGRRET
jgi:AraC-like DNA-binding protein